MMFCKNCDYCFSDELTVCPNCDRPVKKETASSKVNFTPQKPETIQAENKKKGKKTKPGVRALVTILVTAVFISVISVALCAVINTSSIPDGALHIEEFPVVTNNTELIVYDKEKFPSKEYEITVEKYMLGDSLRAVSAKTTEINEISSSRLYELSLEDGCYRITLNDKSSLREYMSIYMDMGVEEYAQIVPAVVIEVVVDGDGEDAVGRVDINSTPGGEIPVDYSVNTDSELEIEATAADIEEFETFVQKILGYAIDDGFDCRTATPEEATEIVMPYLGSAAYYYYFGEGSMKTTSRHGADPLKKWEFPDSDYDASYYKFDGNKVRWICENILHVKYNPDFDIEHCYAHNGSVYKLLPEVGDTPYNYYFVSHEYVDGKYEFIIETAYEYDESYYGVYKVTAALEMVEGDRLWTLYSVENYNYESDYYEEQNYDIFDNLMGKVYGKKEEMTHYTEMPM